MALEQVFPEKPRKDKDKALPFFTASEAQDFRDLFQKEWAKHGHHVTMYADHAKDPANGGEYGLWNLAADCHRHPRDLWPRMIAAHVKSGLQTDPTIDFLGKLTKAQVLRKAYLRLFPVAQLPDPSWYPYAREVAPGVSELVAVHHRRMSYWMRELDIERFGGLEELREAGLTNLRIMPAKHVETIESPHGGSFRVLSGPSSFTSSRLLVLDRVVDQVFGDPEAPNGVLAAIPNRHELALHVIRDRSALPSLVDLVRFAHERIASTPGPLSPDVYWIRHGVYQQIAAAGRDGVQFQFSPQFKDLAVRLPDGDPPEFDDDIVARFPL